MTAEYAYLRDPGLAAVAAQKAVDVGHMYRGDLFDSTDERKLVEYLKAAAKQKKLGKGFSWLQVPWPPTYQVLHADQNRVREESIRGVARN